MFLLLAIAGNAYDLVENDPFQVALSAIQKLSIASTVFSGLSYGIWWRKAIVITNK